MREPVKRADWDNEPMPAQHTALRVDIGYTSDEMAAIRQGVYPEVMEDKWFIFWEAPHLYLHRSWTGFCLFVAEFALADDGSARLVGATVNRDPDQYLSTDDDQDAAMLRFIIDVMLLGRDAEFPGEGGAVGMWGMVGRAILRGDDDE